jgi:prepilin-type N-terminal cleavage/methylation domain-containing protein
MASLRTRLARRLARAHRGMTLLEIMIVLAILALVMGVLVGPRVMAMFSKGKVDTTKLKLQQIANDAYPQWSMAHPDKACPDKPSDLSEYMNSSDLNDAWGKPLKILCGPSLPPGAKGIAVMSSGPDQKEGTEDDLKSWE